ncbi:MAG: hypothetical protein QM622_03475 [Microbacterium sp.]
MSDDRTPSDQAQPSLRERFDEPIARATELTRRTLAWFRLVGIVILVAASWIAVRAGDREIPLEQVSDEQRLYDEHRLLLAAAEVRLRTAREAREAASWFRVWGADRSVREAEDELARIAAAAPPRPTRGILYD